MVLLSIVRCHKQPEAIYTKFNITRHKNRPFFNGKYRCVFLDISHDTWSEWRLKRQDLSDVITRVDGIIYTQKFDGAAAGLLNPNIKRKGVLGSNQYVLKTAR